MINMSEIKSKKKLFLDWDMTIIQTVKAFCDSYNILYKNYSDFKPANWRLSKQYDLRDQCPLVEDVDIIFGSGTFFDVCEFMDRDTKKVIKELSEKYQVIICTIGIPENLAYKSFWIEENLPFVKDFILISNDKCHMDKSIINMKDSVFIDDSASNLYSSNAEFKICFGDVYDWNENWNGKRIRTWSQIKKYLGEDEYVKYDENN